MIREPNFNQLCIEEFKTPFERGLDKKNRWVFLAAMLPWAKLAEIYARRLSKSKGRPALPSRVAIGALIIKHKLRLPDEEVIPAIQENPYLQYFLGYSEFSHTQPFDPSLFVTILKRLGEDSFSAMNEALLAAVSEAEGKDKRGTKEKKTSPSSCDASTQPSTNASCNDEKHSGLLIVDASVAPADIKYPTDLDLLNSCREHSERLIDILWEQVKSPGVVKPLTYRRVARKAYLAMAKKRKKKPKELRKALRKQLNFLRRNLQTINRLWNTFGGASSPFKFHDLRLYWIIQHVYDQQRQMFEERRHNSPDRIVSLSQPHVRPIVRGKAGRNVEFGAKISAGVVDGYVYLDRLSWDAYNEGADIPMQVERYKERHGFLPEAVIADGIYGTRDNRVWLKEKGVRFSGKPLGRPAKETSENEERLKADRKRRKKEFGIRNHIEGKFSEGKRAYDLGLVKAKLPETSKSWIATVFFIMNIARWLRDYFFAPVFSEFKTRLLRLFSFAKEHYYAFQARAV